MLDTEFIKKIRAGDLTIHKQVFDIYYKDLLKYANRFLNDVESSRDLVQEVYYYIWEKRSALAIESSLEAYAILYSGNGILIENLKITNYKGNGIMGQAGNNYVIRNNWIIDTGVYGIFP